MEDSKAEVFTNRKLLWAVISITAFNLIFSIAAMAILTSWHSASKVGIDQVAADKIDETASRMTNQADVGRALGNLKADGDEIIRTTNDTATRQQVNEENVDVVNAFGNSTRPATQPSK
jgi:hypothetical protein